MPAQANDEIVVRFPEERDLDSDTVNHLVDLINRVYDESESGMWKCSGTRTSVEEVEEQLRSGSMILAEIEGAIVGAVSVMIIDEDTGEFGALVADPAFRGRGIGSKLVEASETWAKDRNCSRMRLELLTPREWVHPSKQFLEKWYTRAGYVRTGIEPFEKMHPDKLDRLATPCNFSIWYKRL